LKNKKNIYFLSDAHLGAPGDLPSIEREKLLVKWLDDIADNAAEIFFLGDIFDFWFEYKRVVPRGFTRLLGKISILTDKGLPIHFFTGNHDLWIEDYLPNETGVIIHREPIIKTLNNKKFYIAHGDGLGNYDKSYKLLKKVFLCKPCIWFFKRLHPNFAIWLAHKWSASSRKKHKLPKEPDYNNEWLVQFAKETLKTEHFDFFIFGHRHIPFQYQLNNKSSITNLGDWLINFSYAVFDGEELHLKKFKKEY
jgi:UDP-2,3-diacylglucosamine hydrolase